MHKIAELYTDIAYKGEIMKKQAPLYLTDDCGKCDISIAFSDEYIKSCNRTQPLLSFDECEYLCTGGEFYMKLLDFDGFMLHSSAVMLDGEAYLFSAPSGVGKSTHASLWKKVFGERAVVVNDDKPALRLIGDDVYVFGTPWSGKTDKNANVSARIKGICFLERAPECSISEISSKEALNLILSQTYRPKEQDKMLRLLDVLDRIIPKVRVFKLRCNISEEAVMTVYNHISEA